MTKPGSINKSAGISPSGRVDDENLSIVRLRLTKCEVPSPRKDSGLGMTGMVFAARMGKRKKARPLATWP